MKYRKLITTAVLFTFLVACQNNPCPDGVNGILKDLEGLDGCGFVIEVENGKTLIPMNLEAFDIALSDGSEVLLSYAVQEDAIGICMAGDIVKIECIALR